MKPFSDNIIFVDTEFSTLDPYKGEILSIGLVKQNGEELYLELEYDGEYNDWVKENILPTLKGFKISREEAVIKIQEFIGDSKPFMVSFVNSFDVIYSYKLSRERNPFFWVPIDFASILFSLGINPDPEGYLEFARSLGINTEQYKQHNSLDDAKLLREVYLKMLEKNNNIKN